MVSKAASGSPSHLLINDTSLVSVFLALLLLVVWLLLVLVLVLVLLALVMVVLLLLLLLLLLCSSGLLKKLLGTMKVSRGMARNPHSLRVRLLTHTLGEKKGWRWDNARLSERERERVKVVSNGISSRDKYKQSPIAATQPT
jgi:uncharacterized protein (DUF58 family)